MPADPTQHPGGLTPAAAWPSGPVRTSRADAPEAEARATRLVQEAWKRNTGRRYELRARIGQLCREHAVSATYFDGAERWGVAGDDNQIRLLEAPEAA